MTPSIRLSRDLVSPALRRLARGVADKPRLHRVMGEIVVQTAKAAFNSPGERAETWAPKKDGTPARLRKNNVLARSPRVLSYDSAKATVGSNLRYAAIHQLGGKTRPMPRRPFFPFLDRRPTPSVIRRIDRALRAEIDRLAGR